MNGGGAYFENDKATPFELKDVLCAAGSENISAADTAALNTNAAAGICF